MLTLERAKELTAPVVTEDHLILHELNVCYTMGAMARHFGEDVEHWQAVGMLHDYDYEKYPEEHLEHTAEPLRAAGVSFHVSSVLPLSFLLCSAIAAY